MKHLMGWSDPQYDSSDLSGDELTDKELCHPLCQCRKCAPTQKMQASLVDINAGDEQGRTALHIAVERSNMEIIRMLLQKHAEVNCKTNLVQFTPLHIACQQLSPDKQIVEMLINHGAKVNCKDCNGRTPLHFSSQTGSVPITRLLLESNANVESTNIRGNTPLHEACKVNNTEIVQLLIDSHSNPTLTNKNGLMAMQLTSNPNIIRIITGALERWREEQVSVTTCLPSDVNLVAGPSSRPNTSQVTGSKVKSKVAAQGPLSHRQHLFAALEANDQQKLQLLFSSIGSFNKSSLRRTVTRDLSSPLLNISGLSDFSNLSISPQHNVTDTSSTLAPSNATEHSARGVTGDTGHLVARAADTIGQSVDSAINTTRQPVAGAIGTTGDLAAGATAIIGHSACESDMADRDADSDLTRHNVAGFTQIMEPPECDFHQHQCNEMECENSGTESADELIAHH